MLVTLSFSLSAPNGYEQAKIDEFVAQQLESMTKQTNNGKGSASCQANQKTLYCDKLLLFKKKKNLISFVLIDRVVAELNLEALLDTGGAVLPKSVEESVNKVLEQGGWTHLTNIMEQVRGCFFIYFCRLCMRISNDSKIVVDVDLVSLLIDSFCDAWNAFPSQVTAMSNENRNLLRQLTESVEGEEKQDSEMRAQFPQMAERM
jgi:hypothetical protein